jgi:anti-anti-sigma factor
MEIKKQNVGDRVEIQIIGRMDGYWADHLGAALDEVIREGSHQISLDLSEVPFMSSAGIRILVKFYKQLHALQGSFLIPNASEQVKRVIALSGLKGTLLTDLRPPSATASAVAPAASAPAARRGEMVEKAAGTFELFTLAADAKLNARLVGNPALLRGCHFRKENCLSRAFPETAFAVGVGALGDGFEDCEGRFGEFLAAAGAVAYLPTDGTNVPDYFVPARSSVPEVQVCYAAAFAGSFAKMARFEAKKDAGSLGLTPLVEAGMGFTGAKRLGMVMVAETTGLMGAALRRPPTRVSSERAPFEFPEARQWLSFTAERAFARSLTLVVGIAAQGDAGAMGPVLRPLGTKPDLVGHFHAAAFTYRPVQKGEIDLKDTVRSLFETQSLQGVLHLLGDDRSIAGAGESEFVRGAFWVGPLSDISTEGI